MLDDVDLLVCGAGPAGCVVAERAVNVLGWKVLVIDQRRHIAGNCYDAPHGNGVLVHRYGPHYFRTNDTSVVRYLSAFTDWLPARYEVKSFLRGRLFPFPINLNTLEKYFGVALDRRSAEDLLAQLRVPCANPANSEDYVVSRVGRELYEAFYRNYTLKQWGTHARDLLPSVCGRVPVRLNRDRRYVDHPFQAMPKAGFSAMFSRMLKHRNIRVLLDCRFQEVRHLVRPRGATVYTGPIDGYFDCCLGKLPYRSLKFEFVPYHAAYVQPCVQVNYPNEFPFTRSVEIKHVTGQRHAETVVSYETPLARGEPFYPIPRRENQLLYQRYKELADGTTRRDRVFFVGRLAQYRYFNTDEVVAEALQCFQEIRQACAKPRARSASSLAA
jgi:UDP-galactopyranose mutase